jgi:flavin reductase (DIM6/NTAB) family NADH-FMN oxidoreductase RutF
MEIDPELLNTRAMYEWMIGTILPRPIAWVSTVDGTGRTNLAPFSFFQGVCSRPPTLMFCPVNDRHGRPKDTLLNVETTGEFVVNLVPFPLAGPMNDTAAPLPHGESEFERFGVRPLPSVRVRAPRVAGAPVSYECRLDRVVRISEGPAGGNAVFGRIVHLHVDDGVVGPDGRPNPDRMDLIGRMGGDEYLRLRERFHLTRPG